MKKLLTIFSVLLTSTALAQDIPNHSVPVGGGPGAVGWRSIGPCAASQAPVWSSGTVDPTCQTTVLSGAAAGGDLTGTYPNPTIGTNAVTNAKSAQMVGSTVKCNPTTSTANASDCQLHSADKIYHVSTSGSDSNDGLSWQSAKLTIQAAVDAASTAGKVLVGAGTYTLSTPVYMRAGITLECVPGAIITQANAANLQAIVDFSGFFGGNVATGASIRYCTIDGNRANNTGRLASGNNNLRLIYFGNTSSVVIDRNIIRNGPGYGVHGSSQTGLVVSNNQISETEAHSIFVVYTPAAFQADCRIENNDIEVMLVYGVNGCIINKNRALGSLVGNIFAPLRVNISGTAVTWVSGPDFSFVRTGWLLIANNGAAQCEISAVNSSTSLTLATSCGTFTNNLAMIGNNDLIGLGSATRTVLSNNTARNGASFGLSLYSASGGTMLDGNIIANNVMEFQGKSGFALLGDGGGLGGPGAQNNIIVGNLVINSNSGGLAGCPAGGGCLHSYIITGSTQANILFDNNHAQDNTSQTFTYLNTTGLAAGAVKVGPGNNQIGTNNPGIFGGISSIALSAGWGNTAATSAVVSYGHSAIFTITANGTGIAANPTFTVNTVAAKPSQGTANIIYTCKQVGGTGALTVLSGEQNSTPAQIGAVTFNGTPVAASTYIIQCN